MSFYILYFFKNSDFAYRQWWKSLKRIFLASKIKRLHTGNSKVTDRISWRDDRWAVTFAKSWCQIYPKSNDARSRDFNVHVRVEPEINVEFQLQVNLQYWLIFSGLKLDYGLPGEKYLFIGIMKAVERSNLC